MLTSSFNIINCAVDGWKKIRVDPESKKDTLQWIQNVLRLILSKKNVLEGLRAQSNNLAYFTSASSGSSSKKIKFLPIFNREIILANQTFTNKPFPVFSFSISCLILFLQNPSVCMPFPRSNHKINDFSLKAAIRFFVVPKPCFFFLD